MRKLVLFLVSAFVVACGGSDSKNGGGGPLAGSIAGRAFTPAEVRAITAGSLATPCSVPLGGNDVAVGVKAIALQVTSYADACGDIPASPNTTCRLHSNAQSVTLLVARLRPQSIVNPTPSEPELRPGTYTVASSPASVSGPDVSGLLGVAYAQAFASDATCGGTPSPSVAGGTVRLDQVTGPITGSLSLTFQDGSSLSGDFSAPLCGTSPDVCGLANASLQAGALALCIPTGATCGP